MDWRSGQRKRDELDAELRSHLEMERAARIARGESPDAAARHAAQDLGDPTTIREVTSDMWKGEWMHHLTQDIRHAARRLARVPGFTAVAVITFALGIGANTAIFSVLNGVILKPLAYPEPGRLVYITSQFPTQGFSKFWMDGAEMIEFRQRQTAFSDVGGYVITAVNVGADESPVRATAARVTPGFLEALGVPASHGRFFTDQEYANGGPLAVILSDELWHSAFGGRPVVNTELIIDGVKRMVVGIMPPRFDIHDQSVKAWLAVQADPAQVNNYRGGHFLYGVGRLKEGVTIAKARADLETMLANWVALDGGKPGQVCCGPGYVHAPDPKLHRLQYEDLQAEVVGGISRTVWILQAAVVLVLLVACANLANLLLMRAETQQKELAVRAALGAGRARLFTHFIGESAVLTTAGTAVGILLAYVGLRALLRVGGSAVPMATAIGIDGTVLLFTIALAVVTGAVFGVVPLVHLNAGTLGSNLRDSGTRTTAGSARHRVRRGLVIAEMALAVMLVIGAGLLLRSFWNLSKVDGGFDRTNLSTFGISLPTRVYHDSLRVVAFYNEVTQRLAALPGAQGATAMRGLPPSRQVNANTTRLEGVANQGGFPPTIDYYQYTTPNYFETMHIPIVNGRAFGSSDGPVSPRVVLINETFAKTWYPGLDPIGRRVQVGGDTAYYTIIGVAKDVKQGGVDSKTGTELYFDDEQMPTYQKFAPAAMNVVVRSTLPMSSLIPAVRKIVGAIDPTLPIINFRTMDEVYSDSISRQHFLAELLGTFAVVALLLAAVGTYGVLSYAVAERTREIGIRMALGASGQGVLAMVMRQGMGVAVVGVAIGLVGGWGLMRLASTLLFGVPPYDPATFVAVSLLMFLVAIVAAGVPARRAVAIDPILALRGD